MGLIGVELENVGTPYSRAVLLLGFLLAASLVYASASAALAGAASTGTLQAVQARGYLLCGTTRSGPGLSEPDAGGNWRGFFPDFCRAIAAAIFNDQDAVSFVETERGNRFQALSDGAFDVLMANSSWTAERDVTLGLNFTNVLFFDEQAFLVRKSSGAGRLQDLGASQICAIENTTTIRRLRELARSSSQSIGVRAFASLDAAYDAFLARSCDAITQDRSILLAQLSIRAPDPTQFTLLEDRPAIEPLSPAVRSGDENWQDIVRWTTNAPILAAALGTDRASAQRAMSNLNSLAFLYATQAELAEKLGLPRDWAIRTIAAVGSYDEIFDRNLGDASGHGIARGMNALWSQGGLLVPLPMQ